jgi:hypothetical protein
MTRSGSEVPSPEDRQASRRQRTAPPYETREMRPGLSAPTSGAGGGGPSDARRRRDFETNASE